MKISMTLLPLAALIGTSGWASEIGASHPEREEYTLNYAEKMYGDLAGASGGKVFVGVLNSRNIEGKTVLNENFGVLTGFPNFELVVDMNGNEFVNVRRVSAAYKRLDDDYYSSVSKMNSSMSEETRDLRLLDVVLTVDGVKTEHRALEICTHARGHCFLYDPAIPDLEANVQALRRMRADGWKVTERLVGMLPSDAKSTAAKSCYLDGTAAAKIRSVTKDDYYWEKRNAIGQLQIKKHIHETKLTIQCNTYSTKCQGGVSYTNSLSDATGYGTHNTVACSKNNYYWDSGNLTNKLNPITESAEVITGCSSQTSSPLASLSFEVTGAGSVSFDIAPASGQVGSIHSNNIDEQVVCRYRSPQ